MKLTVIFPSAGHTTILLILKIVFTMYYTYLCMDFTYIFCGRSNVS